jgi:uncharacterized membrane protein YqaE (UPF0057 family)
MAKVICTLCGTVGVPAKITKGNIFIELILWLLFIIPGLIYSIWRLSTRHTGCKSCGQITIIAVDSPMGKNLIKSMADDKTDYHTA